jgi:hypothetical protein
LEANNTFNLTAAREKKVSRFCCHNSNSLDKPSFESEIFTMKAPIIFLVAFATLAGIAGRAQARDHGVHCGGSHFSGSHFHGGSCSSFGVSVGVPLFYYTSPYYNSSVYGSPGYSPYGYYFGPRPYSSYRYQANPYYADTTYVRYAVSGNSSAAAVQVALARRGYYHGEIDGLIGPMSRNAIARYQASHGMDPTGAIDYYLLRSLGIR